MPIIGLTHDNDGTPRLSRTVTVKVAIGLAPTDNEKYPKRLDHFVLLKKQMNGKEIQWVPDPELNEFYQKQNNGKPPREIWVTFLDDDPDKVFRTEYAAYVRRGKWCCGDGETARRRDLGPDGTRWGELKIFNGPCANHGCPEIDSGACAPSADLYFMLNDFPTLGTICRIHTGSYQSIRQIYSALQDLHRITGGRLMGVRAKLFVAPDKNVYEANGKTQSGTKWVLGLELAASDLPKLAEKMIETAKVFQQIKGQLGGQVLSIEEEDSERGEELASEFYPKVEGQIIQSEVVEADSEEALRAEADRLMELDGWNRAQREAKLSQYKGRMAEFLAKVKAYPRQQSCTANTSPSMDRTSSSAAPEDASPVRSVNGGQQPNSATIPSGTEKPATRQSATNAPSQPDQAATTAPYTNPRNNVHAVDITDDDLPDIFRQSPPPQTARPARKGFVF
jgi:hypothetical protein